jgi:predicted DCC family thiol-disulfide oxidoreductase YuxK
MRKPQSTWPENIPRNNAVVLFDGVCNLCNGLVQFLIHHDKRGFLKLAALQSDSGRQLLRWCGHPLDDLDTIVFVDGGRAYFKSSAVLRIVGKLPWPWPVTALALVIPPFVRDWFYDRVARNRYALFGRRETCMLPTPDIQRRFLA